MKLRLLRRNLWLGAAVALALSNAARAELKLPSLFGDHMVLQQKLADPVWGWDTPGTQITVSFAGQDVTTTAGTDGKWRVKLAPVSANAQPQTLTVRGTTTREIRDVLVGEVWICSGQSNMGFQLQQDVAGDVEAAASKSALLRLIKVPQVGTQELQDDFKGEWQLATPTSAARFSDVGLRFGRFLQQILQVPVGLIDNAWGGSNAEAWVRRDALERDPRFKAIIDAAKGLEAQNESPDGKARLARALETWRVGVQRAKTEGKLPPRKPEDWLTGQHRAGNLYAGVLHPTIGYGIKGVIWYQGESNAPRAKEYAALFPFMIEQWRQEWGQGDFPFYWVQLPRYRPEQTQPGEGSTWAELRDAQTATLAVPNTGQAVTIDLGEGKNIHPRDKYHVGERLVRWALVKDYGMKLPYRSPEYRAMTVSGNKVTVTFDCFGGRLEPFDVAEARGFAVCGADRTWHWSKGRVVGPDQVEVWSDEVSAPVAVRYAWADNPSCNLFAESGLPVTPFRTDDFPPTAPQR